MGTGYGGETFQGFLPYYYMQHRTASAWTCSFLICAYVATSMADRCTSFFLDPLALERKKKMSKAARAKAEAELKAKKKAKDIEKKRGYEYGSWRCK